MERNGERWKGKCVLDLKIGARSRGWWGVVYVYVVEFFRGLFVVIVESQKILMDSFRFARYSMVGKEIG